MSKQIAVPKNRVGLIPVATAESLLPKKLKMSMAIDDESIWYVEITSDGVRQKRSCRKAGLEEDFDKNSKSWDVKVLGCWVNMSATNYKQF